MTEIKAPQGDIERTIEKLKNENADLRQRIKELQKENASLKDKLPVTIEEKESPFTMEEITPPATLEEKKSLKLFKKQKKRQLSEKQAASKKFDLEVSSEFEAPSVPLSTTRKSIIEGDSRRMCPSCDNTQHKFIYEETDKTHILMDYPRIYGKKYKCGKCGTEWRVPVALE